MSSWFTVSAVNQCPGRQVYEAEIVPHSQQWECGSCALLSEHCDPAAIDTECQPPFTVCALVVPTAGPLYSFSS